MEFLELVVDSFFVALEVFGDSFKGEWGKMGKDMCAVAVVECFDERVVVWIGYLEGIELLCACGDIDLGRLCEAIVVLEEACFLEALEAGVEVCCL